MNLETVSCFQHLVAVDESIVKWHKKHFYTSLPDFLRIRKKILPLNGSNLGEDIIRRFISLNVAQNKKILKKIPELGMSFIVLFPELREWWQDIEGIIQEMGIQTLSRYDARLTPLQISALYIDKWQDDIMAAKVLYCSQLPSRVLFVRKQENDQNEVTSLLQKLRGHWDGSTEGSIRSAWHQQAKLFLEQVKEANLRWDNLKLLQRIEEAWKVPFYWILSGAHVPENSELLAHFSILHNNQNSLPFQNTI